MATVSAEDEKGRGQKSDGQRKSGRCEKYGAMTYGQFLLENP